MKPDEKWGKEIDYNVYASSHRDRLKFAINQCDVNSIVADPGFSDPGSGDFTLVEGSEALAFGFKNFDMSSFGVVSPALRAIAKTPELPVIYLNLEELHPGSLKDGEVLWQGARLYEPSGEQMSAYGLDFDRKGVGLAMVPENSRAWKKGLRTGDYITGIDDHDIEGIKTFLKIVDGKYAPQSSMVQLYRNQEKIRIELNW
jgi:S1-C subfamily serine protease